MNVKKLILRGVIKTKMKIKTKSFLKRKVSKVEMKQNENEI